MQWKPNTTVAAIIQRDDHFLMVEEIADELHVFNQPAGHLEQGESLTQAVCREVMEETAWEFKPEGIVGLYLYENPHRGITYLRVCFHGTVTEHHAQRELDTGIIGAPWLSRTELLERSAQLRSPMVLRCIDDYLNGQSFSLDLLTYAVQNPTQLA